MNFLILAVSVPLMAYQSNKRRKCILNDHSQLFTEFFLYAWVQVKRDMGGFLIETWNEGG